MASASSEKIQTQAHEFPCIVLHRPGVTLTSVPYYRLIQAGQGESANNDGVKTVCSLCF